MKRIGQTVLMLVLIFFCCHLLPCGYVTAATDTTNQISFKLSSNIYYINGVSHVMDVAPYIKNGRFYIPVKYLANAIGIADENIIWSAPSATVTLTKGDKEVMLIIGDTKLWVKEGTNIIMDVTPEITNGRTFLPARFVAEAFGYSVDYDALTQVVRLNEGFSSKTAMNDIEQQTEVLLTSDYWIPDINKTYVYDYKGVNRGTTCAQNTNVTWTKNPNGTYLRSWGLHEIQPNGTLSQSYDDVDDIYSLKGGSICWESISEGVVQAGSYESTLVSGSKEILKPVKPGQSWINNFITWTDVSDSKERYSETVCFIGFSDFNCLGTTRQVAHIQVTGSGFSDEGTQYEQVGHYVEDYWLAKGIGIVKHKKSEYFTGYAPWKQEDVTEELIAIK